METADRVLVPVDDSEQALTAVTYAVEVATRYDATLWVLYLLSPDTEQALAAGEREPAAVVAAMETVLDQIRSRAAAADRPVVPAAARAFSTARKTQHPGTVILEYATATDADFLVLPRQDDDGVLATAAGHVLAYADQPVLSV